MKHIFIIAVLVLLVVGCDFRSSVKVGIADSKKMESGGVTFLVPLENSSAQDGDFGFKFDGETVKAETKGGVLYVSGRSYGTVKPGDVVNLTFPKRVVINGVEKQPVPVFPLTAVQSGNIGVALGERVADGTLPIALVFPGSPAAEAGVKRNWHLISVDGTNVVNEPSERCMSLLHGAVGTSVTLELADPEMKQTNKFIIKRADVAIPDGLLPFDRLTNAPPSHE